MHIVWPLCDLVCMQIEGTNSAYPIQHVKDIVAGGDGTAAAAAAAATITTTECLQNESA